MITLITGSPGTGKTAWLIAELMKLRTAQPYREIFIHGIRDFTGFRHQTVYCKSKLCDLCTAAAIPDDAHFIESWPDWYKAHFLIVIDEVQRVWSQSNGSNCTEAISRLQTHRHYGLDFWLVSQSPKLIHADVKSMIGRHIHLVQNWAGRKQFEFPECRDNTNSRSDAVIRPYSLPSNIYQYYKSAEVHTTLDKRKPLAFYAVLLIFLVFIGLLGVIYARFSSAKMNTDLVQPAVAAAGVGGALASPAPAADTTASHDKLDVSTPEKLIRAYTPVIPSAPWSAPAYAEMAKPVTFPRVVGCIHNSSKCTCYTQQATIVDMQDAVCRMLVVRKSFNQFQADEQNQQQTPTGSESRVNKPLPKPVNFIHF